MQRVRMSSPYFEDFGWSAEIVTVHPDYVNINQDTLLSKSIPGDIPIHYVKAFSKKWTSKLGLGSIALRSLYFYRRKVDRLLKAKKFDLIYFSTTQFPVCILGAYWKKKFGIPYVIDMQDPWHSDYYLSRPRSERPPKYWFSYRLNKWLEPVAMKSVDGLIAVSTPYLQALETRYSNLSQVPKQTITFGAYAPDFAIARQHKKIIPSVLPSKPSQVSIVYIGRGGADMQEAARYLFLAFRKGLEQNIEGFCQLHFYFIGTSYAANGQGKLTILPIAKENGVGDYVTEITDRIPFYQTLNTLAGASALFVPGSNDPQYTASKIYPYVLARKPLLALFHPASSVVSFLRACRYGTVLTFDQEPVQLQNEILAFLQNIATNKIDVPEPDHQVLEGYSARAMTARQCDLFNEIVR